ncbi:MAG TPA: alpha/beta hydrolase domain-containing protein [Vicinamibacterales bacterium]|nr:alpha/beta hydrolase domain-containing protein [Vicinamibacterales bacterium]
MRTITAAVSGIALLIGAGFARADFVVPPIPSVEGPITEGGDMYPGLRPEAPGTTAADFGYATDEYFVSGTANGQPYKTRILVRHPLPPERFSGIVVTESMHSNGFAVTFEPARKYFFMRGHVHVEIAAQQSNVNTTLKGFNPVRYASLSIPSGAQTSEIIAQVGLLIKSNLSNGPLAPLSVRRLFMEGTSQASAVLRTYQSQKHFQSRLADGSPIMDGYLATSTLGNAAMMVVDVPTVHMPTMTEVNSNGGAYRRPDSDDPANRYRLFEVAGMAHANSRETPTYVPNPCTLPVSDFPWGGMAAMGLNHLIEWVDHGIVPPHAAPLEFDNNTANDGSRFALDKNGNVKGGVRNTYVDVPVAQYGVPNAGATPAAQFNCSIAGWRVAFDQETLNDIYRNKGSYISAINRRLMELVREGWMLPEYADDVRADAQAIEITPPGRR